MFESIEIFLGEKIKEKELKSIKGLPVYMTSGRKMFEISFDGGFFIAVCISDFDRFGVVALKKQIALYEDFFEQPIAFSFNELTKVQRDSLIKHGVPFMVLPTQVYVPFLGIMLSDSFKKKKKVLADKMMPATQSLYLYLLSKNGEGISKMSSADALKLTRMSISRASEQLEAMDLIIQENVGKNIFMRLKAYGKEAYELAAPYLINPVKATIVVKDCKKLNSLPAAGETALASYSMLGEPVITTKAISKDSPIIKDLEEIDERWNPEFPCVRLQLWKYDPLLFSHNGIVDRVSLMMSFANNKDERIEEALDICMEGLNG